MPGECGCPGKEQHTQREAIPAQAGDTNPLFPGGSLGRWGGGSPVPFSRFYCRFPSNGWQFDLKAIYGRGLWATRGWWGVVDTLDYRRHQASNHPFAGTGHTQQGRLSRSWKPFSQVLGQQPDVLPISRWDLGQDALGIK